MVIFGPDGYFQVLTWHIMDKKLDSYSVHYHLVTFFIRVLSTSLQCFDTVGWAAGRASGL